MILCSTQTQEKIHVSPSISCHWLVRAFRSSRPQGELKDELLDGAPHVRRIRTDDCNTANTSNTLALTLEPPPIPNPEPDQYLPSFLPLERTSHYCIDIDECRQLLAPTKLHPVITNLKVVLCGNQSVRLHSAATPNITHTSGLTSVGSSTAMTKFVDMPVVLSTPFLSAVLYTGHA